MNIKLTVFFEDPFWVGVFERYDEDKIFVAKCTFGAEPKDYEVYSRLRRNYFDLKFSYGSDFDSGEKNIKKVNPKRMQRQIKKEMVKKVGTKSQNLLKEHYKNNKKEVKRENKKKTEEEDRRKYLIKQRKKREKRKGH